MNRKTFSLLFFLRKRKTTESQRWIYLRITVDGERAEISVKRSIDLSQWNTAKGCAKNTSPFAKEINARLDQVRTQIYHHERDLIDRNKLVTAQALKDAYLNINDQGNRMLLEVYEEHNQDLKSRINQGTAPGTYERHVTSRKHLESYIADTYNKRDFLLRDIDHQFITRYETYLRTKRNCANNTTVKYIKNFGKIIRYGLHNDWIRVNPFRNIRLRLEVDKPYLTMEELTTIMKKDIRIQRVSRVRDAFVFCCFTGLAFVDVKSLTIKDFEKGHDGGTWLKKQRHKSKQWQHVPLLPQAKSILEKYTLDPDCISKGLLLPVPTNQKMNSYLKEVADICGIDKNLTTHCARHTFATSVLLANKSVNGKCFENARTFKPQDDTEIREDSRFNNR
jgi:integrase